MNTFLAVCAAILLGVWIVETVLFVLSYRTSARDEGSQPAETSL